MSYTPIERPLYLGVVFPRTPMFKKTIAQAELHQAEGSHDVLSLVFKGVLDKNKDGILKKGDPVAFTWGTGTNKELFIGFIELIEKNVTVNRSTLRVVCINNSSVFRVPSKKVYKNHTADKVARILANEQGFEAQVEPHTFVHTNLSQSGQTNWQLLKHLSAKTGYALRAENKTLIFKPKHSIVSEKIASAPVFIHFNTVPPGAQGMQTLLSFTALDSVSSPGTNSGDMGIEMHNNDGNRYAFDSKTGLPSHIYPGGAVNTTQDWGKINGS